MGLKPKNNGGSKIYLNAMFGALVQKVKAETEGTKKRVNKKGDTVFEIHHGSLTGKLISAEVVESESYGKFIELNMESDGTTYNVSIPLKSGYSRTLLNKWPNVDLTQEFELSPYDFTGNDGKRVIGMGINQNGEKVDYKWTKENPGKRPEPKKVEFDGEMKWDYGAVTKFLIKAFEYHNESLPAPVANPEPPVEEFATDEEDDLPF